MKIGLMAKSRHLMKTTSVLSLLVFLFATVGIHLIHPFMHHYHCHKCSLHAACIDSEHAPLAVHEKRSGDKSHGECPICSFLLHFNLHKVEPHALPDQRECLRGFPFAFKSAFVKQIAFQPIQPRAPPAFTI